MKVIEDSIFNYFIWGGLIMGTRVSDSLKNKDKPVLIKKRYADYVKYIIGINITDLMVFNLSEPQYFIFAEEAYESGYYCRVTILE